MFSEEYASERNELMSPESSETSNQLNQASFVSSDGFSGEPFLSQHLTIDFKPIESMDTDFVQKKCCAFWEFLNSRSELSHLMVYPEKSHPSESISDAKSTQTLNLQYDKPEKTMKTAVSMLEIVEKKGVIDRAFETKLPQSMCSLASREYRENGTVPPPTTKAKGKKKACTSCIGECKTCKHMPRSSSGSTEVKNLCKEIQNWDEKHPKCMEPPGHPPPLVHSIMQRHVKYNK